MKLQGPITGDKITTSIPSIRANMKMKHKIKKKTIRKELYHLPKNSLSNRGLCPTRPKKSGSPDPNKF